MCELAPLPAPMTMPSYRMLFQLWLSKVLTLGGLVLLLALPISRLFYASTMLF